MGCCGTKGAVWKAKLEDVKLRIMMRKPWRKTYASGQPPDIAELSRAVNDLEQCHGYFESEGTDRESLGIIQNLANALVEELHSLMDPRLIKQHRGALEHMVRLSKQVNNFRANKSDLVGQKYKALVKEELRKLLDSCEYSMSSTQSG
ncbi:Uncharacterized protein SCF082_LOCUS18276 [Durusdinium trenchii]|uniref:Uncharacterized protein n=1 Tax=Durusdinium trenchii TaxID=1381693 RepID=A0ABP0KN45_9DINO